jgi:hypothetical protein
MEPGEIAFGETAGDEAQKGKQDRTDHNEKLSLFRRQHHSHIRRNVSLDHGLSLEWKVDSFRRRNLNAVHFD